MPNWCVNKLSVKGPQVDVEAFFRFISGTTLEQDFATRLEGQDLEARFDYNDFIPYPASYTEQDDIAEAAHKQGDYTVKDGYNSGGYDWCIANWGTKWNAAGVKRLSRNCLQFDSPWGPPLPVVQAVALRFPALIFTLRYFECGMGFQGVYQVKGETVMRDAQHEYTGSLGG